MLLHQVLLLTTTLLFCFLAGRVHGDETTTVETTDLPRFGFGFIEKMVEHLHERYLQNRAKNNESLALFNIIWSQNFPVVADEIRGIADEVQKVSTAYDALHSLQDSNLPLVQKGIQLGTQTAQLSASALSLIANLNKVLLDITTKFGGLIPIFTSAFTRNLKFLSEIGTYVTFQVYKRANRILGEFLQVLHEVQIRAQAALDQLEIALLRVSVSVARIEVPVKRFANAIKDQVQIPLYKMLMAISVAEVHIKQLMNKIQVLMRARVEKIRRITAPFRNIRNKIRDFRKNLVQGVRNIFRGIFHRKGPSNGPTAEPNNSTEPSSGPNSSDSPQGDSSNADSASNKPVTPAENASTAKP